MKKRQGVFWIIEAFIAAGTAAAVWTLSGAHWALSVFAAVCGIAGASAYFLHFRSLTYTLENECIVIQKGFIIRARCEIPLDSILMTRSVTIYGYTLCTSIKTAGGGTVLFCETDRELCIQRCEEHRTPKCKSAPDDRERKNGNA